MHGEPVGTRLGTEPGGSSLPHEHKDCQYQFCIRPMTVPSSILVRYNANAEYNSIDDTRHVTRQSRNRWAIGPRRGLHPSPPFTPVDSHSSSEHRRHPCPPLHIIDPQSSRTAFSPTTAHRPPPTMPVITMCISVPGLLLLCSNKCDFHPFAVPIKDSSSPIASHFALHDIDSASYVS